MNDDELELAILQKYVDQHKLIGENNSNKCSRELDMRNVLKEITGKDNQDLEYNAKLWLNRLAPHNPGKSKGILRPCSNSTLQNAAHKYHARAFTDVINGQPAPAWDRIRELKEKISKQKDTEEIVFQSKIKEDDIIEFKPNFYGIGLNLKALWKKIKSKFKL